MCNESLIDKMTFHIVAKIQRAGKREIYAMDMASKIHQNPIESYFGLLCKYIPNEFISVNSSKRASQIHTAFFDRNIPGWVNTTLNLISWRCRSRERGITEEVFTLD